MPTSNYDVNINVVARDRTSRGISSAKRGLTGLASAAKLAALGYAALRTAQKAVDFVKLGANVQMAEKRLTAFAGGIEQANKYMDALSRGSDGTIDRLTGLEQASRMLETAMVTNTREMELAAAMVAKLGNQTRSTESRMQMLTLLLANQSTLRLDEFGLSIDAVRDKQEKLEAQGLSTAEAFRTAVFEEAERKLAVLGDTSQETATQIDRVAGTWKTMTQIMAQGYAILVENTGILGTLANWLTTIAERTEIVNEATAKALDLGVAPRAYAEAYLEAARASQHWQQDEEELRKTLEAAAAAQREQNAATRQSVMSAEEQARSIFETQTAYINLQSAIRGTVAALEEVAYAARVAAMEQAFAVQDMAMQYASLAQQAAYSYSDYGTSMAEIEAQYQDTVARIQEGATGGGGGGGGVTREFDRADIERGLNIMELQLKELEAQQAAFDATKEATDPVFWYELSRQDRKWLMEHGKTLEDITLKREDAVDEVTELERAQMDDRIQDLKKEITDTKELLEKGHYEQHQIRTGWAKRDTTALLEEARIRRDEQIAQLEAQQVREEYLRQQSLGRIKLAAFDNWVKMNQDQLLKSEESRRIVEQMRQDIAEEYGLLTTTILEETQTWWDAFDEGLTSIKEKADEARKALTEMLAVPVTEPGRLGGEFRQHGGPVRAGQMYLVGERGPELFVPGASGQVVNHTRTEQIIGSHNTYNIHGATEAAFMSARQRAAARNAYARASGM